MRLIRLYSVFFSFGLVLSLAGCSFILAWSDARPHGLAVGDIPRKSPTQCQIPTTREAACPSLQGSRKYAATSLIPPLTLVKFEDHFDFASPSTQPSQCGVTRSDAEWHYRETCWTTCGSVIVALIGLISAFYIPADDGKTRFIILSVACGIMLIILIWTTRGFGSQQPVSAAQVDVDTIRGAIANDFARDQTQRTEDTKRLIDAFTQLALRVVDQKNTVQPTAFDHARDLAVIAGTVVAIVTFIKAVVEFTRQNKQKRAEQYIDLRDAFKGNRRFDKLFGLLETDDPSLAQIPFHIKQDFLGFYEDIALLVKSGLMRRTVAHYMFAYYAIRCWNSENFWKGMNKNSPYWWLFRHFAEEMQAIEEKFLIAPDSVRNFDL